MNIAAGKVYRQQASGRWTRRDWNIFYREADDRHFSAQIGQSADLPDEEILARLFALNQERAAAGR